VTSDILRGYLKFPFPSPGFDRAGFWRSSSSAFMLQDSSFKYL